jgi:hypothetical protein
MGGKETVITQEGERRKGRRENERRIEMRKEYKEGKEREGERKGRSGRDVWGRVRIE